MKRVGVIGSLVWDEIHGRDPLIAPVEEWGGIAYALSAMDAALPADWELVPLIKVGRDLAPRAAEFLRTLSHVAPGSRFIEVPVPNNRVTLRYESTMRRCERMSGGVPAWTWPELGPLVSDLDALYVNFISGFEMCLGTAEALRQGFSGPIYADLHSLFFGMNPDGVRVLQPLPHAKTWYSYFDVVQMNEEEMSQVGKDPLVVAADALSAGVALLVVTVGAKGVIYVARPGNGRTPLLPSPFSLLSSTVQTERIPAIPVDSVDPTGCGDVFGATAFSRLLAGDDIPSALTSANSAAARNATFRGASGLSSHLRGQLVEA